MYEDQTFEEIMERMLDRIPDTMDKREGSVIYDALAPAAFELQNAYIELDYIINQTFADTAEREYLVRRGAERGLVPYPATKASLKAETAPASLQIPIGSRFSLNELNYVITSKIQNGEYVVQCETEGTIGNEFLGYLIPIDYIAGLESIEMTEVLIPGEDEEDTEDFRERYFDSFDTKPYGGNKKDYREKVNAIAGVGSTKVIPVWNGGGTVLLIILDASYGKASSTLINTVQEEVDPTQTGSGDGIAPIGHVVTVRTADETTINISTHITFQEGYTWEGMEETIKDCVEAYLLEIRTNWANETQSVVRTAQIDTRILNIEGVVDISNTKINGTAGNLVLDAYAIPKMGVITNV